MHQTKEMHGHVADYIYRIESSIDYIDDSTLYKDTSTVPADRFISFETQFYFSRLI